MADVKYKNMNLWNLENPEIVAEKSDPKKPGFPRTIYLLPSPTIWKYETDK